MSNQIPTPETDDAQFGTDRVSTDFARRLERERDEWKACAEERKQEWYSIQSAFERSRDEVAGLERERDEAREVLNDIRRNLGADMDGHGDNVLHAVCALQNELDDVVADLDQWREVARRFHRATAPNAGCIDIPALRGAIAEFERLKEAQ
jgi:chromosome segregation ATPase